MMYRRWFLPSERGSSTAFDNFFLGVVILLIATGIATELSRFVLPPLPSLAIYIVHLETVVTLFVTFPFSKFAHMLYRILAMVHEDMASTALVKVSADSRDGRALAATTQGNP